MVRFERVGARLREIDAVVVDALLALAFFVFGVAAALGQNIHTDEGLLRDGFREPNAWLAVTALAVCAPIALRRRWPLAALLASAAGIVSHLLLRWPEGALPLAVAFLAYTVGSLCTAWRVAVAMVSVACALVGLSLYHSPGLDAVGASGVFAQLAGATAIGVAVRSRRAATEAQVREAETRAESERAAAARALAEERLRIAQELHDVVAHSMSVIAVQAGAGAHVLERDPEKARVALEAISSASRNTLGELRRLLGVLRAEDGTLSTAPTPGLADLAVLVEEVRGVGMPVTLHLDGAAAHAHPGVELSAYRIVQEALTNVIKHAGPTTAVAVSVRRLPHALAIEVRDDGRGLAASGACPGAGRPGHGLAGMRERVEVWGGELSTGPAPGGGYRVRALLPVSEP